MTAVRSQLFLSSAVLGVVTACGGAADAPPDAVQSAFAVAPAGSASSFATTPIPGTMVPGERVHVAATVTNSGTVDWSPTSEWFLRNPDFDFGVTNLFFAAPVLQGNSETVRFVLTAPSANATFDLSVVANVPGNTGLVPGALSVPITIDPLAQPQFGCTFQSTTLSNPIVAGSIETIDVVVRNSGAQNWTANDFCLFARETEDTINPDYFRWGNGVCIPITAAVNSGADTTFTFQITAPSVPGTYRFMRQMRDLRSFDAGSIGVFSLTDLCVDESITVTTGVPSFGASSTANTIPTTVAPNSLNSATVTFRNDGSTSWVNDGTFSVLGSSSTLSDWRTISIPVTTTVNTNDTIQLSFTFLAPNSVGTETLSLQMNKTGVGPFGTRLDVPITISGAITPPLDASVLSQTIPSTLGANEVANFSIELRNDGTEEWLADGTFSLQSVDRPSPWNTSSVPVTVATSSGATFTFSFAVGGPSTPGTYQSRWQMFRTGVGSFGEVATTSGIVVSPPAGCGDGTVVSPETCDDGNVVPNDGCSASCQVEPQEVDLGVGPVGRTFLGPAFNRQLSSVEIADLNSDGFDDVIMSDYSDIRLLTSARAQAGRIYVYFGGAGFFTNASQSVGASPDISIIGRDRADWLGALYGGARVADVTGDGNRDLVVGAQFASGESNANFRTGEAYVFVGGATLYGGGDFLMASTAPESPFVSSSSIEGTTIVGEAADDRLSVLAVGDVTNDGTADIILGAQSNDSNGANSGEVYVIAGGSSLATTATIALSSATIAARLTGPGAQAAFGAAAAVADFDGDGINDLAVSAPNFSSNGRNRNGVVYVVSGPVSGTLAMSNPASSRTRFVGEANHVLYGMDLAVADIGGSSAADLVVGAAQGSQGVQQVGNVHVWFGNLSAGEIDTAVTGPTGSDIFGGNLDYLGGTVAAGDTNGDGFDDVLFGAGLADGPGNTRNSCGEMGIVLGGSLLPGRVNWPETLASFRVNGAAANDGMASHRESLAAGDIDGDGRVDWCVGSRLGGDSVAVSAGQVDCFQSPW